VVRTVVALGVLIVVVMLDIAASVRVARWDAITSVQRSAWLLLIWIVPLLGAALALQVSSEVTGGPPTGQSSGFGISDSVSPDVGSHNGGFGGDGHGGDGGGGH
jgi:hypothetical protein